MTLNVHLLHTPEESHLVYLQQKLESSIHLTTGDDDILTNVHILIAGRPQPEQIKDKPDLHTILIPFAGVPKETSELLSDFPHIALHNLHHNAPMTGEMALALLLATAKHLLPIDRTFRMHDWRPRYDTVPSVILDGKTLLIIGYGSIGRYVGRVCEAMGMNVIGIRRTANQAEGIFPPNVLQELLPQTQAVLIATPATPETEGMIGADELALLPKGAILVNVGRGMVVEQKALYDALKSGHLFGAGIDVWYNYPQSVEVRQNTPPADYPFHELDNVVMSPHRAGGGGTDEVEYRRMNALAESLNAVARGDSMPHRVNLETGY